MMWSMAQLVNSNINTPDHWERSLPTPTPHNPPERYTKKHAIYTQTIHVTGIFTYIYHKDKPLTWVNIPYMDDMGYRNKTARNKNWWQIYTLPKFNSSSPLKSYRFTQKERTLICWPWAFWRVVGVGSDPFPLVNLGQTKPAISVAIFYQHMTWNKETNCPENGDADSGLKDFFSFFGAPAVTWQPLGPRD